MKRIVVHNALKFITYSLHSRAKRLEWFWYCTVCSNKSSQLGGTSRISFSYLIRRGTILGIWVYDWWQRTVSSSVYQAIETSCRYLHRAEQFIGANCIIHLTRKMELRASTWDWPWRHPTPRRLSVELGPSSGVECVLYRFVLSVQIIHWKLR